MRTDALMRVRLRARCELLERALLILAEAATLPSKALDEGARGKMAAALLQARQRGVAPMTLDVIKAADRALYWLAWRRQARQTMRGAPSRRVAH